MAMPQAVGQYSPNYYAGSNENVANSPEGNDGRHNIRESTTSSNSIPKGDSNGVNHQGSGESLWSKVAPWAVGSTVFMSLIPGSDSANATETVTQVIGAVTEKLNEAAQDCADCWPQTLGYSLLAGGIGIAGGFALRHFGPAIKEKFSSDNEATPSADTPRNNDLEIGLDENAPMLEEKRDDVAGDEKTTGADQEHPIPPEGLKSAASISGAPGYTPVAAEDIPNIDNSGTDSQEHVAVKSGDEDKTEAPDVRT